MKEMIETMVKTLNEASAKYYNGEDSGMTDREWDLLFNKLKIAEKKTGLMLPDSPTKNVGYKVLSDIPKIKLNHPMLSLDKCHSIEEVTQFMGNKPVVCSLKLDGLSVSLTYEDGELIKATTRGNGEIGSDITEHIKHFDNVPTHIGFKGTYIIDGEAIIMTDDFKTMNSIEKYKNPRNLAAGTLNLLDMKTVASRHLRFVAWNVIEGDNSNSLHERLTNAKKFFNVVPMTKIDNSNLLKSTIDGRRKYAENNHFPIDGIVISFDDIAYGKSLGRTGHHFKSGVAYKFEDEKTETTLLNIEYSMGKTGDLTPVAVFEPIELDGTTVNRASLHNISICKELELGIGDTITVFKANQIIPQIEENLTRSGFILGINKCPICGKAVEIKKDNNSEVLICTNSNCTGKLLGKMNHFVSREAINIDGLSEATLEKLIYLGYVKTFEDIYRLEEHKTQIINLDGFGTKSYNKLIDSINISRNTTFERFLCSLSIPLIGKTASKDISKFVYNLAEEKDWGGFNRGDIWGFFMDEIIFNDWKYWLQLKGFGEKMAKSLYDYFYDNGNKLDGLVYQLNFAHEDSEQSNLLEGMVFCITGSVIHFKNRDELKNKIESLGGKVTGSVTSKTNYLINNDVNSTSSKNKKAKDLGIPIITEEEFIEKIK